MWKTPKGSTNDVVLGAGLSTVSVFGVWEICLKQKLFLQFHLNSRNYTFHLQEETSFLIYLIGFWIKK